MNDDELRARLRAMPAPTASIDVDAVVADARRRRRPKVVGVTIAAAASCLAVLTPVVIVGLDGLGGQAATTSMESAQEPAAPTASDDAGEPAEESGVQGGDESAQSPLPDACAAPEPVEDAVAGLSIAFGDDPADGSATLVLSSSADEPLGVVVGDVGTVVLSGGLVATSTELDAAAQTSAFVVDAQSPVTLTVDLATSTVACGYGPGGLDPAPLVVLEVDGASRVVVGTPWIG